MVPFRLRPMLRKLFVLSLIGLMPAHSMRMICVGAAADTKPPAAAAAALPQGADCEDMCSRVREPLPDPDCILLAGGCLHTLVAVAAVTDSNQLALQGQSVSGRVHIDPNATYSMPTLSPHGPPPKA